MVRSTRNACGALVQLLSCRGGLNNSVGLRNICDYADFAVFNENIWLRTSVEEKSLSHSTLLPLRPGLLVPRPPTFEKRASCGVLIRAGSLQFTRPGLQSCPCSFGPGVCHVSLVWTERSRQFKAPIRLATWCLGMPLLPLPHTARSQLLSPTWKQTPSCLHSNLGTGNSTTYP